MNRNDVEWTGMNRNEVEWTAMNRNEVEWTGMNRNDTGIDRNDTGMNRNKFFLKKSLLLVNVLICVLLYFHFLHDYDVASLVIKASSNRFHGLAFFSFDFL